MSLDLVGAELSGEGPTPFQVPQPESIGHWFIDVKIVDVKFVVKPDVSELLEHIGSLSYLSSVGLIGQHRFH
jgi:hypothetical protein